MALGSLAENPDSGLKIVPCGMNYFHAHKFRSRAVVEFGSPIEVPRELVEKYKRGERREAVGELLDTIYHALLAVTVNGPDYETLMVSVLPFFQIACRTTKKASGRSSCPSFVQYKGKEASFADGHRVESSPNYRLRTLQG